MIFTADQITTIQHQLAEERKVRPPQGVLQAVAALIGQGSASALICESKSSDEQSTTWRVVGLLDSDCVFDVEAVGDEHDWDYGSWKDADGRVLFRLSAHLRSLSDVASLTLTGATSYGTRRGQGFDPDKRTEPWDVATAWEISWRDGSPTLALPTRTDATAAEFAAAEAIVDKVRKVLEAR
jgi:hypothetical protein